nr:tetratricopeptide repeat protein [uncultured Campylobacter sp.]
MPCDSEMVTEYYKKCCDYSKNKVQLCCEKGYPKELEEKRNAACKAKDSKSCGKLAYIAHKQKDYEKLFKYAKKGCDNGKDNTSCVHLAYMYYYGQGVEKDYKKSFNLYEGLCERGIYGMCPILSHFYTDGVGMKQDIKKGKEILEALCYDKYPEGCANLAALYESDKYGMKDDKKATELYTMACKHNPKGPACDKIGGMSKRLEFVCTEQKNDYDCIQLADTYYRNDLGKKLFFYNKACEFGNTSACNRIASITEQKEASEKQKSAC